MAADPAGVADRALQQRALSAVHGDRGAGPREWRAGDEMYHAPVGVGAVERGAGAAHHLDPVELVVSRGDEKRDVEPERRNRHRPEVAQNQERARVDAAGSPRGERPLRDAPLRHVHAGDAFELLDRPAHRRAPGELIGPDHRERGGCAETGARGAIGRHHPLLEHVDPLQRDPKPRDRLGRSRDRVQPAGREAERRGRQPIPVAGQSHEAKAAAWIGRRRPRRGVGRAPEPDRAAAERRPGGAIHDRSSDGDALPGRRRRQEQAGGGHHREDSRAQRHRASVQGTGGSSSSAASPA